MIDPIVQAISELAEDRQPRRFVVENLMESGRVYGLTGRGNDGAAIATTLAAAVVRGADFGPYPTAKGTVLHLAAEDPEGSVDRWRALAASQGLDPSHGGLHLVRGRFELRHGLEEIRDRMAALHGKLEVVGLPLSLVIVDSATSLYDGLDDQDFHEMREFARSLRSITAWAGNPAVIALTAPAKAAQEKAKLLPAGSNGFFQELDSNLVAWRPAKRDLVSLHWVGRHRGAEFRPIEFRLETALVPGAETNFGTGVTTEIAIWGGGAAMPGPPVCPGNREVLPTGGSRRVTRDKQFRARG